MSNVEPTTVTQDLSWLWALVAATVTQFVNYIIGRRKEAKEVAKAGAEAQGAELDNVEKAVAIWRKLAEEMNAQVVELKAQVKTLADEISKLQVENITLKSQIQELRDENIALKSQITK